MPAIFTVLRHTIHYKIRLLLTLYRLHPPPFFYIVKPKLLALQPLPPPKKVSKNCTLSGALVFSHPLKFPSPTLAVRWLLHILVSLSRMWSFIFFFLVLVLIGRQQSRERASNFFSPSNESSRIIFPAQLLLNTHFFFLFPDFL